MQLSILDAIEASQLRDEGIQKAIDHANDVTPDWSKRAYLFLLSFLGTHPGPFMMEEVRSHAALMDFPLPPHARAWGGIIARAAKAGIVERVGIQKVKNIKAHCANAAVWIKV